MHLKFTIDIVGSEITIDATFVDNNICKPYNELNGQTLHRVTKVFCWKSSSLHSPKKLLLLVFCVLCNLCSEWARLQTQTNNLIILLVIGRWVRSRTTYRWRWGSCPKTLLLFLNFHKAIIIKPWQVWVLCLARSINSRSFEQIIFSLDRKCSGILYFSKFRLILTGSLV